MDDDRPHCVDHPVLSRTRRLVFAHRGGAGLRPENTFAAFDYGLELGADGLEIDVRLTRDGEVVVFHDAVLDRTTDARGPLSRCTWRELARVDAGYRFGTDGRHPFRGRAVSIPRLADVLTRYPGTPLIVELKGIDLRLAQAAVAAVRAGDALGRVCFGGFDDATIRAARACGRDVVTGAARGEIRRALWASWVGLPPLRPRFQALQVPERFGRRRVTTPRFVRAASRGGIPVQVWTVDDRAAMGRLLGWGVQAIITDRPDVAVPVVREFNARAGQSIRRHSTEFRD
jgi:glycerophosphoryl diester phosphodiesterase